MFSASLSLAAKNTPRTGKKYQGVFAVSRRGGDEKTDGRTESACFLHREPLKTRRVHQEPLHGTARPFRTPGGPLRYRMLHRQKGERPCLRTNFSNCQKREGHCKKRSPECRREQENHSQKVCNAAPKLLSATRKSLYAPKLLSAPRKSDITPLSESKKPISETDRLSGSG